MNTELKALLEQATPTELVEIQRHVSTLLRGHSGANPKKVTTLVKRTTTSNTVPQALHFTQEFYAKALAKIFFTVFGWSVNANAIRANKRFEESYQSVANCFNFLELKNDSFFEILQEAGIIIKRKLEQSPIELNSYTVFDKLCRFDETLLGAHPAARYVKGYFAKFEIGESLDNKN